MTIEITEAEEEQVMTDWAWWKDIAALVGAQVTGFSHRYAATFIFPDGTTSEIRGGLLKALAALAQKEGG